MPMTAKEIIVRNFKVDPKEIVYIKAVLESYEGMVVMRTVEVGQNIIELLIAHDFAPTVDRLIQDLASRVEMLEVPVSSPPSWP